MMPRYLSTGADDNETTRLSEFAKPLPCQASEHICPSTKHIASPAFMPSDSAAIALKSGIATTGMLYVNFWLAAWGSTAFPMEIPFRPRAAAGVASRHRVPERREGESLRWDDLDNVKWPDASQAHQLRAFEIVAGLYSEGVKSSAGLLRPFEWPRR